MGGGLSECKQDQKAQQVGSPERNPTAPSTVAPVAVGRTLSDQQKEEKEKQACFLDRFPWLCGCKLEMDGSHPTDSK